MAPRQVVVSAGTASLHVSVWGGEGPSILALHPGVGDSRIWRWCAPTWAAAGYRVIAYDRRGFGRTRCRPERHDDVVDLLAVTEATETRSAFLVGNSRGGGLAIDLALARPDLVAAMALLAPSPSGYDDVDWPTTPAEAEQDELIAAAEESGDQDLTNRLEVRYWLDGVDQPERRVTGEARDLMLDMNGLALRSDPIGERAERRPAWPHLPEITVPTVVVVGEFDLPGIRRQCTEAAESLPAGELATMPGSAHCPSLDQPEELARLVLSFFNRNTVPKGPEADPFSR